MDTSKTNVYWTIAFATLLLIAIATYWLGGKGNEIVSYVSFASAIVSIILALVAIFYSFVQNVNSQQNIGEMRTLVSEASRIMTEKAGTLAERAVSMEDHIKQLTPLLKPSAKVSGTVKPLKDKTFSFDVSGSSISFVLTLYYLAKCCELQKPMKLWSLATLIGNVTEKEEVSDDIKRAGYFYGIGVLQCLQCFWGFKNIVFSEEVGKGHVAAINEVPSGFQENILEVIDNRMRDTDEPSEKERLSTAMKEIDAFVAA
jgi:hypothetical protein